MRDTPKAIQFRGRRYEKSKSRFSSSLGEHLIKVIPKLKSKIAQGSRRLYSTISDDIRQDCKCSPLEDPSADQARHPSLQMRVHGPFLPAYFLRRRYSPPSGRAVAAAATAATAAAAAVRVRR